MTNVSGFERSLKIEFSGIYLPVVLCTYPLQMSEFCALLVTCSFLSRE